MTTFQLQIVTPDGLLFEGEAERLVARTIDGDVCILARHTEYVTALGMGQARVTIDGKVRKAACIGGMLSVSGGRVRIVATTFEWAEEIDLERAQRARERAEERLKQQKDTSDIQLAEAKLKRALVRLNASR